MKLTLRDLEVRGKRVLVRVDFNVPVEERDGKIVDHGRHPDPRLAAHDQLAARAWRENDFDVAFWPAERQTSRQFHPCDQWRIICTP